MSQKLTDKIRQRGRVVKAMPCYLFRDIIGIVFARVGSNPAVVDVLFASRRFDFYLFLFC